MSLFSKGTSSLSTEKTHSSFVLFTRLALTFILSKQTLRYKLYSSAENKSSIAFFFFVNGNKEGWEISLGAVITEMYKWNCQIIPLKALFSGYFRKGAICVMPTIINWNFWNSLQLLDPLNSPIKWSALVKGMAWSTQSVWISAKVLHSVRKREEVPIHSWHKYATSFLWRSGWRRRAGKGNLDIYFCRPWSCHSMNNSHSAKELSMWVIPMWLNKDFKVRMCFWVQDQADEDTLSMW